MRILDIRPNPPGSTRLARFDLELNDHLKLFNLALRQRGDEPRTSLRRTPSSSASRAFPRPSARRLPNWLLNPLWSFRPPMHALRSVARTLGGQVASRNSVLVPGPGHSRRDRSLKVKFKPDGTFSVTSFAGDDWAQCKDYVRAKLGLPSDWHRQPDREPVIYLREVRDDEPERIRGALQRWAHAAPITGTLAEKYLASRGLTYSGDAVRFRENDRTMVALMTDIVTNEPCGAHVTYLDGEGRKIARKMYGKAKGAVVRLSDDTDVEYGLGIGEGIETALATGFAPIWSCLSAGTMAAFPVLGGIEALTIFADRDHAGMSAANACGRIWHEAGKEVEIVAPSEIGADFADELEVA